LCLVRVISRPFALRIALQCFRGISNNSRNLHWYQLSYTDSPWHSCAHASIHSLHYTFKLHANGKPHIGEIQHSNLSHNLGLTPSFRWVGLNPLWTSQVVQSLVTWHYHLSSSTLTTDMFNPRTWHVENISLTPFFKPSFTGTYVADECYQTGSQWFLSLFVAHLFWAVCLPGLWSSPLFLFLSLSWVLSFYKVWQGFIIYTNIPTLYTMQLSLEFELVNNHIILCSS
jgi:hypothetical protein